MARSSRRSVTRTLMCLLLVSAPVAGADEGPLGPWLEARAREQVAWFEGRWAREDASEDGAKLWRELAPDANVLPGFVPPTSLAPLIRAVESGVVNINTVNASNRYGTEGRSTGSGFVLTPDGLVVTNNHVVATARQIVVRLANGREFPAEVVGRDASTDVALLRLKGVGDEPLPAVYLGDSDRLDVGDWVVAIGNPFGLDHSVSHGLISAKERVLGVDVFDDFIQTDALINPGNSGGPLFNMRGEVVGVNTAIIKQGQGIGFAVPINLVKDLLPNLRENGRLERGWLGVSIDDGHDWSGGTLGTLVVRDVYRKSPAAEAGIRTGDRIVAVNGKPIDSYLQLLRKVALLAPGTQTRLTLLRGGESQEVMVKLARRPAPETMQALASPGNLNEFGLVLQDVTPEEAPRLGLKEYSGALVAGVVPRSAAASAGITPGDLIVEVNRRKVKDVAGVRAAIGRGETGTRVLLRVQRGDTLQYITLSP